MENLKDIWKTALAQIEIKLDTPAKFKTWFKDTILMEIELGRAKIGVKNAYAADWLKKRHSLLIQETLSYVYGKKLELDFVIEKSLVNIPIEKIKETKQSSIFDVQNGINVHFQDAINRAGLNPSYSFQNFIVGDSNALAHAAALGVTKNPGKSYNPLFIYGKTGLGKTHLAHAVGKSLLDKDPNKKIIYVSSETFMNDMINAIQTGKNIEFRRRFRTLDVLIIDDIQLISKRAKTQEEFFNTFNILYNTNKQIILISDVAPEKLQYIDDRLRSRFQGGMAVEVYQPDFETRLAIVNKKCLSMSVVLNEDVREYLAKEIRDNIRELEGAIQKISLYNAIGGSPLSIEEIERILGKDAKSKRASIKVPSILKHIGREFDVTVKDLKGPKRYSNLAFARQVCMYILREEFKYKLEQTAYFLNRKDHTTVIHAVDKIQSKIMVDDSFKEQINILIEDLKSESGK